MVSNMVPGSGSSLQHGSYASSSPAVNQYNVSSSPYNLQTPAYQNTMSPHTQRLIGSIAQVPAAYNPEAANAELSDSDN
jgi:hypothetical protein